MATTPSSPRRRPPLFSLLAIAVAALFTLSLSVLADPSYFEGFDSDDLDEVPISLPPPLPTTITTPSATSPPPPPPPPPPPSSAPSDLEIWDEDEFEGIPPPSPDLVLPSPLTASDPPPPPTPLPRLSYTIEIAALTVLIAFTANYFAGRRENEQIALAWISRFATKDAVLDKNFSILGSGDAAPLLLREGRDVVKLYARGRRHCLGLLATLELRARHDLIARVVDLVLRRRDTVTFEVVMNEDAMDHVVFALASRSVAKAMHKEVRDLQRFASVVAVPPPGRRWVAEDLVVISETKEVAGNLITDVVLDQVFGEKVFDKLGKWFVSLHFSDQHLGSHKKMLIFKFALPDAKNMADMTRLITLVPYYIDLIGRYKLSSQARSKTEAARTKAAQEAFKELQNARQEVLQKRKADRKKIVEEAEAKLIAEAIRRKR